MDDNDGIELLDRWFSCGLLLPTSAILTSRHPSQSKHNPTWDFQTSRRDFDRHCQFFDTKKTNSSHFERNPHSNHHKSKHYGDCLHAPIFFRNQPKVLQMECTCLMVHRSGDFYCYCCRFHTTPITVEPAFFGNASSLSSIIFHFESIHCSSEGSRCSASLWK